eukprot:scaffold107892_cov39-Phaeocystis_antarctica.AAC.1
MFKSKKIKGCSDGGKKSKEAAKRRREAENAKLAELSCVASTATLERLLSCAERNCSLQAALGAAGQAAST